MFANGSFDAGAAYWQSLAIEQPHTAMNPPALHLPDHPTLRDYAVSRQ